MELTKDQVKTNASPRSQKHRQIMQRSAWNIRKQKPICDIILNYIQRNYRIRWYFRQSAPCLMSTGLPLLICSVFLIHAHAGPLFWPSPRTRAHQRVVRVECTKRCLLSALEWLGQMVPISRFLHTMPIERLSIWTQHLTVQLFEILDEFSFIFFAENGHVAIDYKAFLI